MLKPKSYITLKKVISLLQRAIDAEGSQLAFAKKHGFNPGFISNIMAKLRKPSEKVLAAIGIVPVENIFYRQITTTGKPGKIVDQEKILKLIRDKIDKTGSQAALAKEIAVTPSYICNVMTGIRPPSKKMLGAVGYEKVETYKVAD
jgi:transcriptional regulator with XRE-family HTH domain